MSKVVIEINNGLFTNAYTDVNDLEVIIVDWDNINYQGASAEIMCPLGLKRLPEETIKEIENIER